MVCNLVLSRNTLDQCIMELNNTWNTSYFNFSSQDALQILLEHKRRDRNLDAFTEGILIAIYSVLIAAGILANLVVSFVVARRPQMRTPRNLYIVNLTVSDLALCLVCMPFTLFGIIRRHWNLGLVLCKLVPAVQGTNIMVSIGTITVIALDRYWTIVLGQDHASSKRRVITSILMVWLFAFIATLPLIFYQVIEPFTLNLTDTQLSVTLYETCLEKWPTPQLKLAYTVCWLLVQAVIPALVVGLIHAKIASYLHAHASTQRDSRRAQRELQRNRRTTLLLSGVAVLFAVSWLPFGVFSLLADLFYDPNSIDPQSLYVSLAACHIAAMSSAVSNPVVYGWLNSNIRRELTQLLPGKCLRRRPSPTEATATEPSPTLLLCQNGQKPQQPSATTTYTAL